MRKAIVLLLAIHLIVGGLMAGMLYNERDVLAGVGKPEVLARGLSEEKKDIQETEYIDNIIAKVNVADDTAREVQVATHKVSDQKTQEKVCYLTFDDGPGNYTEELLDILDEYNVKATFFVVGNRLNEQGIKTLKRMYESGHTIGIHCYNHDYDVVYKSKKAYLEDFQKTYDKIYEAIGLKVELFRFPGGSTATGGLKVIPSIIDDLESRGFIYHDWNVSCGDGFSESTTKSVISQTKNTFQNFKQPVVLMHDVKGSTVWAIPELIDIIRSAGYSFDTLDYRDPVQFPRKIASNE